MLGLQEKRTASTVQGEKFHSARGTGAISKNVPLSEVLRLRVQIPGIPLDSIRSYHSFMTSDKDDIEMTLRSDERHKKQKIGQ